MLGCFAKEIRASCNSALYKEGNWLFWQHARGPATED